MANSELPSARPLTPESARRALTPWLAARLESPDLEIVAWRSAGAGNSADTFFATVTGHMPGGAREMRLVVRRQNLGSDIFLESDLGLPTRVMAAVAAHPQGAGIPVPHVVGLESDASLVGAPFMVMEQLPGRILPQSPNYNKEGWLADMPAETQARVWRGCLEMLARIHRLPVKGHFEFLEQPHRGRAPFDQYLHWIEEWYRWARAGRPHRVTDVAIEYLKANRPRGGQVSLLWGDPQPTNLLFLADGTISGVIDWEMAVLGPPEADLAWWLFFDDLFSKGMGVPPCGAAGARGVHSMVRGRARSAGREFGLLRRSRRLSHGDRRHALGRSANSARTDPGNDHGARERADRAAARGITWRTAARSRSGFRRAHGRVGHGSLARKGRVALTPVPQLCSRCQNSARVCAKLCMCPMRGHT